MTKILSIDGLPVLDAYETLTIHVTAQDIARADIKHPEGCAVARACMRETHAIEARVHLGRVYIRTSKDHWNRYITPRSMRDEIIAFDRGGKFEPGEFTLQIPSPTIKLGKHYGGKNKPRSSKLRKLAPKRRSPTIVKNVRTGPA